MLRHDKMAGQESTPYGEAQGCVMNGFQPSLE